MKKVLFLLGVSTLVLTGCGNDTLNEGVYNGEAIDTYGGANNTATAKVTIDTEGKITDVYLDTTYVVDGVETTKRDLGDSYGMKAPYGSEWEWYEHADALEAAVIENQGIDFITLDENGKTDAVSGCTIQIEPLYNAIKDALEKAN